LELEQAVAFYEMGSRRCRPAATLTTLQELQKLASAAYSGFHAGVPSQPAVKMPNSLGVLDVLKCRTAMIKSSPFIFPAMSDPSSPYSQSPLNFEDRNEHSTPLSNGTGGTGLMDYYDAMVNPGANFGTGIASGANAIPHSTSPPSVDYTPQHCPAQYNPFQHTQQFIRPDFAQTSQPPLNALGFMNQAEIWQEFLSDLGIRM